MEYVNASQTSTNKSHEEYLRRIHKALVFIQDHLDEAIQLKDVATASHFSPFHFHRLFHGIVGETVHDYLTRKRMERAALRLQKWVAFPRVLIFPKPLNYTLA